MVSWRACFIASAVMIAGVLPVAAESGAATEQVTCSIKIGKSSFAPGRCAVTRTDGEIMFSWPRGGTSVYRVELAFEDEDAAHGNWNGLAARDQTDVSLGRLEKAGSCWQGTEPVVSICLYFPEPTDAASQVTTGDHETAEEEWVDVDEQPTRPRPSDHLGGGGGGRLGGMGQSFRCHLDVGELLGPMGGAFVGGMSGSQQSSEVTFQPLADGGILVNGNRAEFAGEIPDQPGVWMVHVVELMPRFTFPNVPGTTAEGREDFRRQYSGMMVGSLREAGFGDRRAFVIGAQRRIVMGNFLESGLEDISEPFCY